MEVTEKTIDVEELMRSKMGAKADRVPRFVVRFLERLIHQDRLNEFLWMARDEKGTPWLKHALAYLGNKVNIYGAENLPASDDPRRYTFVCNHPLGGIDGVAVGSVIGEKYSDNFRYLVNDFLMSLPGLAPLCVPINKTGNQGRDFPRLVDSTFAGDTHVVLFPAGLCSRRINGVIHDLPWTKTFIKKSIQTQRDVVPMYFSGRNSNRFYHIANLCKALRLKVNLAMLTLVDEMFRNEGKEFSLYIGRPVPWQTFDGSRTAQQWAQWMQDKTYALRPSKDK